MTFTETLALLEAVRRGELSPAAAAHRCQSEETGSAINAGIAITTSARVDLDRQRRCGFSEVLFCEGKSTEAVEEIFATLVEAKQDAFGTRASPYQAAAVRKRFPQAEHNPVARTIRVRAGNDQPLVGRVAVVTAGSADRPVAEEAVETLHWMGCGVERIDDVGVAGPQRLLMEVPRLRTADVIVVVAGMEGALPSVVGGHVGCPVIAVPTSVGYGASFGGIAALLGMLNSCAANVTVVNIDAGFKAGYVAGLIARRSRNAETATGNSESGPQATGSGRSTI